MAFYAILKILMEFVHEATMKAIMSNTLREIISDPKKNEDLKLGLSKHLSNKPNKDRIKIGGKIYTVKLVNSTSR